MWEFRVAQIPHRQNDLHTTCSIIHFFLLDKPWNMALGKTFLTKICFGSFCVIGEHVTQHVFFLHCLGGISRNGMPSIASRSHRYYEKRKIYRIRSLRLTRPLATGFTIVGPVQSGQFFNLPHTRHPKFWKIPGGYHAKKRRRKEILSRSLQFAKALSAMGVSGIGLALGATSQGSLFQKSPWGFTLRLQPLSIFLFVFLIFLER
jgi:hypothetical protein